MEEIGPSRNSRHLKPESGQAGTLYIYLPISIICYRTIGYREVLLLKNWNLFGKRVFQILLIYIVYIYNIYYICICIYMYEEETLEYILNPEFKLTLSKVLGVHEEYLTEKIVVTRTWLDLRDLGKLLKSLGLKFPHLQIGLECKSWRFCSGLKFWIYEKTLDFYSLLPSITDFYENRSCKSRTKLWLKTSSILYILHLQQTP